MLITFTSKNDSKTIDTSCTIIELSLDKICLVLFPDLIYRDFSLYSKSESKGYFYNSQVEKKIYDVKVISVDSDLQNTLEQNLIYIEPIFQSREYCDSESGSECESVDSRKTSDMIYGSGYSDNNMITNTFCGFGFIPRF